MVDGWLPDVLTATLLLLVLKVLSCMEFNTNVL